MNVFTEKIITPIDGLLRMILPIIISLAVLYFVWGLAKYIKDSSNEGINEEAKSIMVWGVIVIFVMVSMWGLVRILTLTFGITGNEPPPIINVGELIPVPRS